MLKEMIGSEIDQKLSITGFADNIENVLKIKILVNKILRKGLRNLFLKR